MQGFTVRICHAIARTAAFNLAFLVLCTAGLGVLGVAPATAALMRASDRIASSGDRSHELSIVALVIDMAREWRVEFARANLAAGPFLLLAALLLVLGWQARAHPLAPLTAFASLACLTFAGATLAGIARRAGSLRDALVNGATLLALAPGRLLLLDVAWLVLFAGVALQHLLAPLGLFALHAALSARLLATPFAAGGTARVPA